MRIGLISDTHGTFADDVKAFLKDVDVIWHAGDFGTLDCARSIAGFKPLVGVYGNCDGTDIRLEHPFYRCFDCEGIKVLMTHIGLRKGSYWAYDPKRPVYDEAARSLIERYRPGIFVCGHSHIPQVFNDRQNGFLFMNPGACGYQGSRDVPRMALRFCIDGGRIHDMEKCEMEWK